MRETGGAGGTQGWLSATAAVPQNPTRRAPEMLQRVIFANSFQHSQLESALILAAKKAWNKKSQECRNDIMMWMEWWHATVSVSYSSFDTGHFTASTNIFGEKVTNCCLQIPHDSQSFKSSKNASHPVTIPCEDEMFSTYLWQTSVSRIVRKYCFRTTVSKAWVNIVSVYYSFQDHFVLRSATQL